VKSEYNALYEKVAFCSDDLRFDTAAGCLFSRIPHRHQ
jgi:hypothetical protein